MTERLPTGQETHRYEALDAWRGVAALLVTAYHVPVAHALHAEAWYKNAVFFVDFFFVLSGFVIAHAYGHRLDTGLRAQGFMIRRFGRVWPLHIALLGGFVLLEIAKLLASRFMTLPLDGAPFTADRSVEALVGNVFLVQALDIFGTTSWNTAAWSIGVEFYTYLLYAVAVLLFGPRTFMYLLLALIGATGVALFSDQWLATTHDFGIFRCIYGFFLGSATYSLVRSSSSRLLSSTGGEVGVILAMAIFLAFTGYDATSLFAPLICAVVIYAFAAERGAVSGFMRTRPMQALGLWSYSIYMVHLLIFSVEKMALTFVASKAPGLGLTAPVVSPVKLWSFGHAGLDFALFAINIGLTLAVSAMTYRWIEAPARDWFNGLARRWENRRPVRQAAVQPAARM